MTTQTAETTRMEQPAQHHHEWPLVRPRVEIRETDDELMLCAEMPGVDEEHVDVTLEKNLLTIRGTTTPVQPEGFQLVYSEWQPTNFERVFTLSDTIDRDGVEATVKDGILRLKLPKSQMAKPHKIAIKAG